MHKIKNVSFWFRILFQIAFVIIPITLIVYWLQAPEPFYIMGKSAGFTFTYIPDSYTHGMILHEFNATTRILGFLISMIPVGMQELGLYFLIRLFKLYEKAEIFTNKTVNYLKKLGYTMLISQLLNPIYEALLTFTITFNNPPGHRIASISLTGANLSILFFGFLTILISWIMAEGCKLREEQQLTV